MVMRALYEAVFEGLHKASKLGLLRALTRNTVSIRYEWFGGTVEG